MDCDARRRFGARRLIAGLVVGCMVAAGAAGPAWAQAGGANPVYADDSPAAKDTLARVVELAAAGNTGQAVRALQRLLDESGDRVLESPTDPGLFTSVRARVHELLLADAELLEAYRQNEEPRARQELAAGNAEAVERGRFLTRAGFDAALRVAQGHMESARFHAARLALEPLRTHPDWSAPAGEGGEQPQKSAARLYVQVASYIDAPAPRQTAERWAQDAGLAGDEAVVVARRVPEVLRTPVFSPLTVNPALSSELPSRPLATGALRGDGAEVRPNEEEPSPFAAAAPEPSGRDVVIPTEAAWVFPTVAGDVLLVNDGTSISALDRLTLTPRWSVKPEWQTPDEVDTPWSDGRSGVARGFSRALEDASSVSVSGYIAVATTGLALSSRRTGDPRVHAVNVRTGELMWSVRLADVDRQLESASVRGPALIDADTVVIGAVRNVPNRRLVTVWLVGMDLSTGARKWTRLLASAGSLPYGPQNAVSDAGVLVDGIVYRSDRIGVVAAVEAATGRPVWVRCTPVADEEFRMRTGSPWAGGVPVVSGEQVFVLEPGRSGGGTGGGVRRLDRATGRVLGGRASGLPPDARYLVQAGAHLAVVGAARIAVFEVGNFETGAALSGPSYGDGQIRGRVVFAGGRLLVPTRTGVDVLDPAKPQDPERVIATSRSGNIVSMAQGLVMADASNVHTFVPWEVAESSLRERMARDPRDPSPAVALAHLAYRAGRAELAPAAADAAMAAIELDPRSASNESARRTLAQALLAMIENTQARWDGAAPRDVEASLGPAVDQALLRPLVDRLGRAVAGHDERVSHLMVLGKLREREGAWAEAVEVYQRVLIDPLLAQATWRGPTFSSRAELEASRRVVGIVKSAGTGAYAAFDAQAKSELASLGAGASPEALEQLARRYPASTAAPAALLRAAEGYDRASKTHAAIGALSSALGRAEEGVAAGRAAQDVQLGEIAGLLVSRLMQRERYAAAAQLLSRVRDTYPTLALTTGGRPLDPSVTVENVMRSLAALQRLPRIGPTVSADVQVLSGWQVMRPVITRGSGRATEHLMLSSDRQQRVSLWGFGGGGGGAKAEGAGAAEAQAGGGAEGSELHELWTRPTGGRTPKLLRATPETVFLLWADERGPSIERIDAVGGKTRWKSEPIPELMPQSAEHERRVVDALIGRDRFDMPFGGERRPSDLIVSMDESVVAVAEVAGRVVVLDAETGARLWSVVTPACPVHDLDAGGGVVAVGGARLALDAAEAEGQDRAVAQSVVSVYEARGGELVRQIAGDQVPGSVLWVRGMEPSGLLVGLDTRVLSFDPAAGRVNWTIPQGPIFGFRESWLFGEKLFILDEQRQLWLASSSSGRVSPAPVDTREKLSGPSAVEATQVGVNTLFATRRGMLLVDQQGELKGADTLDSPTSLSTPKASEKYFVTIGTASGVRRPDGRHQHMLYTLAADSGMLVGAQPVMLNSDPVDVVVLDGRIVVTSGMNTLVFFAGAN